jgi:dihydrofolate reductase
MSVSVDGLSPTGRAHSLDATDKAVGIGGAGLSATAIQVGLLDELRMFRNPIVVGGGTPFLAPVTENVPAGPDRSQDVRPARDLRALRARPR